MNLRRSSYFHNSVLALMRKSKIGKFRVRHKVWKGSNLSVGDTEFSYPSSVSSVPKISSTRSAILIQYHQMQLVVETFVASVNE